MRLISCKTSSWLALIALTFVTAAAILHCGDALAQARNPFSVGITEGGGNPMGIAGWILAKQAEFERLLSSAVRAVKTDNHAIWTLAGLSFLYGVFHAAGPGHGKAVVSSYLIANERALRRGLVISLLAALLQGLVAVAIIGVLALVLHSTAPLMVSVASLVEKASYVGITALGLWLVWCKGRELILSWLDRGPQVKSQANQSAFVCEACDADSTQIHSADCGHVHMPDPSRLGGATFSWQAAAMTVVAAGLRPCSGAILVLVFALAQGLFLVGVAATFAMALGTAITTGVLAAVAVLAKDIALWVTRPDSRRAFLVGRSAEFLAACVVLFFGAALLLGVSGVDI